MKLKTPVIPFPIIAAVVIAVVAHIPPDAHLLRLDPPRLGWQPEAIERAGWSLLKTKVVMFGAAGFFGMLAGLTLIGLTTSAQANVAERYTLLSIAGVILGGGSFVGGRVSPVGAVIGAMTLTLSAPFLTFLKIPPDWQIGVQAGHPDHRARAPRHHRPTGAAAMTMLRDLFRKPLALVLRRGLPCLARDHGLHRRAGRRRADQGRR